MRAFLQAARVELAALGRGGRAPRPTIFQPGAAGASVQTPEDITAWFLVRVPFRTSRLVGAFTFGDREHTIDVALRPRSWGGEAEQYHLWEWAEVFGIGAAVARPADWVFTVERARRSVAALGAVLRRVAPLAGAAGNDVRKRLHGAWSARQAAAIEEYRRRAHRRAANQAAEAFRRREYGRVLELLEPFQARLSPAERARYESARRSVGAE